MNSISAVVIGFEQTSYTVEVNESDVTRTIGLVVQGQLRRDVSVRVYTEPGSATG